MNMQIQHSADHRRLPRWAFLILASIFFLLLLKIDIAAAANDELVLMVQPILNQEKTIKAFQPLADYISRITGKKSVVRAMPNFFSYWDTIRQAGSYDLVLDAAHFTDYRAQKMNFEILAKIPDTVSYSLIVPENTLIFDPTELTGKTIASLGPPSIGAARLSAMFPNPVRQPIIVEVSSSAEGMDLLVNGRVRAAILPTPLVSQRMSGEGGIVVVTTTEPIPHIAISASPRMNKAMRDQIRSALLTADKNEEGRKMLKGIGFPKFDPATPEVYADQSNILKEFWGY